MEQVRILVLYDFDGWDNSTSIGYLVTPALSTWWWGSVVIAAWFLSQRYVSEFESRVVVVTFLSMNPQIVLSANQEELWSREYRITRDAQSNVERWRRDERRFERRWAKWAQAAERNSGWNFDWCEDIVFPFNCINDRFKLWKHKQLVPCCFGSTILLILSQ